MNRCERCQPLILDHLYGLLDGPDEAMVEAHLRECAACATARDEAARVQGLLAKAARGAFPQVRFEAPAAAPAPTPAPAARRPSPAARGAGIAFWLPWAVAAAVLLAIPSTVVPVLGVLKKADSVRRAVDDSTAQLTATIDHAGKEREQIDEPRRVARRELSVRTQELQRVLDSWVAGDKSARAPRGGAVEVLRPASVQPGAPNEFQVVVRGGLAAGTGRLTAEIREVRTAGAERTDAVILSKELKPNQMEAQPLRLPAEAWARLSPQSELFLVVSSEDPRTGARKAIQEPVRLFGPVYATMLVTDKPQYRPGETLHFRSLTLDRTTFRPPDREQVLEYELHERDTGRRAGPGKIAAGGTDLVRVAGGKVDPVVAAGRPVRGVGCGSFVLPNDLADGDYSLVLREQSLPGGPPPAVPTPVVRPIKVRSTPADVYQKRIAFAAASFAAGQPVDGYAELKLQGRPVAGAEVQAVATADGAVIGPVQTGPATGPDGRVGLRFTLPPELERGDVRLKVTFRSKDNVVETATDAVPVVGKSVAVEFFPEGGELVAGVPCRVYFRATTPAGGPVDVRGTLTDGRRSLAKVETLTDPTPGANRGIGWLEFTPEIDTPVWLKLEAPAGVHAPIIVPNARDFPSAASAVAGVPLACSTRTGFPLPKVKAEGVVMRVIDPVTAPGQPVRVRLWSVGQARKLVVGAYTRGRLSDTKTVTAEPNQMAEVALMAGADPRGGVVRITVFEDPGEPAADAKGDADLRPVAERLVFRRPGEALNIAFDVNGPRGAGGAFVAGAPVELGITAADEKGNPAAAVLYAAAVNSGVAPGEKDRLLTTHFLIAGEVSTPDAMEYADFLLTDHPRAAEVLDLVLATQGWRRFAEQTPRGYINRPVAPSPDSARLLVFNGQYPVWTDPAAVREERKLLDTYWPQYEAARKARDRARAALDAANDDRTGEVRAAELARQVEAARAAALENRARADGVSEQVDAFRRAAKFGVAGFGLLGLLLGTVCLARPAVRLPLGIGTAGSLGLVAFLIIALGTAERTQAAVIEVAKAEPPDLAPPAKADPGPAEPENQAAVPGQGVVVPGKNVGGETRNQRNVPGPGGGGVGGVDGAAGVAAGVATGGSPRIFAKGMGSGPIPPASSLPAGEPKDYRLLPQKGLVLPNVEPKTAFGGDSAARPGGPDGRESPPGGRGGYTPAPGAPRTTGPAQGPTPLAGPGTPPPSIELPRPSADKLRLGAAASDMVRSPAAAVPAAPVLAPPAPGGMSGRPTGDVRTGLEAALRDADKALQFNKARVQELSEQVVEGLARKRSVTVDELKRELERLKKGSGWVAGQDRRDPAVRLAPEEVRALLRLERAMPKVAPLVVREYAAPRPGSEPGRETPDTVLWQPVIVLPADGKTTIPFHLGFAPGGYEVVVAGHTLDGRIGAVRGIIPVASPLPTEPSAPPAPPGQPAPVPPPAP